MHNVINVNGVVVNFHYSKLVCSKCFRESCNHVSIGYLEVTYYEHNQGNRDSKWMDRIVVRPTFDCPNEYHPLWLNGFLRHIGMSESDARKEHYNGKVHWIMEAPCQ